MRSVTEGGASTSQPFGEGGLEVGSLHLTYRVEPGTEASYQFGVAGVRWGRRTARARKPGLRTGPGVGPHGSSGRAGRGRIASVTDYRFEDLPGEAEAVDSPDELADATRDIADVPAIEVIGAAAVHLMSAAAVKCGLADDPGTETDLDEARKLITALAGLITASAPDLSDSHARPLRDGLRTLQLAFREASSVPDPIGKGPGEKWTGPVT